MITLLDYGAGNVRSVINAIEKLGQRITVAKTGRDILEAEKLVFPGVGNFGSMMNILRQKQFVEPLLGYLGSGRPFLGICVGMQALFEGSDEAPAEKGLSILPGRVKRFDVDLAVPHIGWNGIRVKQPTDLFHGLDGDEKFYFVHSYHAVADDPAVVLTTTDYGYPFVSAVQQKTSRAPSFIRKKAALPA
jgi:glutamine amidotransferase/cyclase